MKRFQLFKRTIQSRHIFYFAIIVMWLICVLCLPPEWSDRVGIVGLVIGMFFYMRWANDTDEPPPCWACGMVQQSLRFRDMETRIEELLHQMAEDVRPLLARLPEEANELTAQEWQKLLIFLSSRKIQRKYGIMFDSEILTILTTLQRYGDTADLPDLSHCAKKIFPLWIRETGAISEAAEACVLVLAGRLDREMESNTLLRPAVRSDAPDELLRPVTGAGENDSDPPTLLRMAVEAGVKSEQKDV